MRFSLILQWIERFKQVAIKEKLFSYILFRPKGRKSTHIHDEYGLEKLRAASSANDIYLDGNADDLARELQKMEEEFKVYKYQSRFQIPFSISANRGYLVEHYFLKSLTKTKFYTKDQHKASAFVLPATPYMYYMLVQIWWKLLQVLRIKPNPKTDGEFEFNQKRKLEEWFLKKAIARAVDSAYFEQGKRHVYFSSKLGTEFLEKVNNDLFQHAHLVVNSADAKRGFFNPQKDVSSVCMKDYKIPKYAADINAFDIPFDRRKYFGYYAGMIYGQRGWVHEKRTEECLWLDHHVPFAQYLTYYSQSKYYFHFPGSSEWSPRLFEGMWFGAVPVVVYEQYTLPFSDLLDWTKFAVLVPMDKIQQTYDILKSITPQEWEDKRFHLKAALKHFVYHKKPVPGDAFYMTMYSVYQRILKS